MEINQKAYIKVYYLVYINRTKKIKRMEETISYMYRSNRLARNDDFWTIKDTIKKDYKSTDIVWIETIEILWRNWTDWYMLDFEEYLKEKWKTIL